MSALRETIEKEKSVKIRERDVQILLVKIFEVKNRLVSEIMTEVFKLKEGFKNNNSLQRQMHQVLCI